MLIDPIGGTTDVYRKGADGLWVLHPFLKDESNHLFDTLYHALAPSIPDAVLVIADRRYFDKAKRFG